MNLHATPLAGAFVIEVEPLADERGHFARTFDAEVFAAAGLDGRVAQRSVSVSARRHTLRGMHFQVAPHAETKLVRCTRGAIFDVIVDLRDGSPTRHHWYGTELSAHRALYVPAGFAHGFLTLAPDVEVDYQMSVPFHADSARGVRWDDPAFGIAWPAVPEVISARDAGWPLV